MARRVFFCFHYADVISFRANVVRNHWVTKEKRHSAGFFDASLWEQTRRKGKDSLKRLINEGLKNTSATCVLVGSQTFVRPWVRYEVLKSIKKGNKVLGVHINGIPDKSKKTKNLGINPFNYLGLKYSADGYRLTMYEYKNSCWSTYTEVGGSSSYILSKQAPLEKRGKFFKLSTFYPTYLWNKNNGYKNFTKWVDG